MGIYDRDYYRRPSRGGFGSFNAWSVTTWLILINVAVFVLEGVLRRTGSIADGAGWTLGDHPADFMPPLERWGYFSTATAVLGLQAWRFITFQFLHASPMHLVGNMLGLYFFGPIVEGLFGGRRYLAFYLLCGLAGAVSYMGLAAAHVLDTDPTTPLIGASAGVFGLLVAAAMIAPDVQVFYYVVPVTVRTLAVLGMLVAAYAVFAGGGGNTGGEAAHLGGGVLGFFFIKNQHWLSPFAPARRSTGVAASRRRRRALQKDWTKDFNR